MSRANGAYREFLERKHLRIQPAGIDADPSAINPMLFPFQRDLTAWALRKGRAAIFADTGMGKTLMQVEWARLMGERTLIVAPLSVARQTAREARKVGVDVRYVRDQGDVSGTHQIWITNYEMLPHFRPDQFGAVVLDESSILKALDGKTRTRLIEAFAETPYRLCCTATPAPNDYIELGNHAHFLGVSTTAEMLSMFFVNANKQHAIEIDGQIIERKGSNKGGTEWRLKHHAEDAFFRWLASWAITLTKPSDLGYDDNGFILPPLNVSPVYVQASYQPQDQLFFTGLKGLANRADVRRQTLDARLAALRRVIGGSADQWVIWCGLDVEQDAAAEMLGDKCTSVYGSLSADEKERRLDSWLAGDAQFLVSKPRVAGFGLNLQQSHHMAFMGLNDSWETYYQCIRREWRYGQQQPVNVHLILSEQEAEIHENIMRKDALARRLREKLVEAVRDHERSELGLASSIHVEYNDEVDFTLPTWIGGHHEDHLHLHGMRQNGYENQESEEHAHHSQVLQPEVQRDSEACDQARANGQCRIPLLELWKVSSDLSESLSPQELHPEVLQPEVLGRCAEGPGESSMERWATLPEWIRCDLSA